ncbi:uncharacterized protein VP01_4485g4 [Puccinia sorghi]|uniref:Uncharacterized protein n=1 Tax=Puccinia sorghi TaxID=27349 RepID=A0A0L6UQ51_9BASI|nr:uncharacterized protein VP01_4485g4 [Puccinia sorghi]
MSNWRDPSWEQSALNARSSSRHRNVSQPNLPSHSNQSALGKGPTHLEVEALFDCVLNDKGKLTDHDFKRDESLAGNPSIVVNPATPDPPRSAKPTTSASKDQAPPADRGSLFDEELFKKFLFFTKMMQAIAPTPPPPKPATGELSLVLHKWLPNVPKLHVNGDNFHTWVVMIQQALKGTLGYSIVLTDKDLVLESEEDMLLKTALLATIANDMKVGVAESLSGLDGF